MNNPRFPRRLLVAIGRDDMRRVQDEAARRRLSLSEYARQALLLKLKRDGVGPMSKQQTNKPEEARPS